jgi:hypothetical protein
VSKTGLDDLVNAIDKLTKALVISLNREKSEQIRALDAIGYPSPEIASLVGTSPENVRQALHRLKTERGKRARKTKTEVTS